MANGLLGDWNYYPATSNVTLAANQTATLDISLLSKHTGFVAGTVRDSVTLLPIPDAQGYFALTHVAVGQNNEPLGVPVTASAPGFNSQTRNVMIFCGYRWRYRRHLL